MTHRWTAHLLEWGSAAPGEWLWPPPGAAHRPGVALSFHLLAPRGDTPVKCAVLWRGWLPPGGRSGWGARRVRRWLTLGVVGAPPGRWAESARPDGLALTTATGGVVRLARPRRFDLSRWGSTLRGGVAAPHRWGAYHVAAGALLG